MSSEKKSIQKAVLISKSKGHDIERLRQDIYRPDMEKLRLFTQMLRANSLFEKAKVTHK